MCFDWIRSINQGDFVRDDAADAIMRWIRNHLEPYDSMWVNYYRLNTTGLSMRTSSIGEALHASIKSGYDQVYSAMSPEKSATAMVVKAGKRARKTIKSNARQLVSTALWTDSETANFLTKYCEDKAQEQWELSRKCTVVRQCQEKFLVWTPSLPEEHSYNSVVPAFLRVRTVTIIDGKYAGCTCGLPVRNKYPCRHIMAVVKKRHWKMYGVRWLIQYNFAFERQTPWTILF
jgi:hypothetical protein